MAQLVKSSPGKHEDPSSVPRAHVNKARHCGIDLVRILVLGEAEARQRQGRGSPVPGTHWSANLI